MTRIIQRRGANAVEFALTLPVFIFFMTGVFDYGYLMMSKAVLDAAVSEGIREGAIRDPALVPDIEVIAENRAQEIAAVLCGGSCTFVCTDSGTSPNRQLTCTGTWPTTPLVGFVPFPAQLTTTSRQLLEWQR